jgi:uncharacterized membrane protein YhaH (DUF805 family)
MFDFAPSEGAARSAAHLLLSPQGRASRRQWWLGHLWAPLLGGLGFLGGVGVFIAIAMQFGLDPAGIAMKTLVLGAAMLCVLLVAGASNALCRRRLNARGKAHDLADALLGLTLLWLALALYQGICLLFGGEGALPALPQWLMDAVAVLCGTSLAALVFECGVFVELSLTDLWRGGRSDQRLGSRIEA